MGMGMGMGEGKTTIFRAPKRRNPVTLPKTNVGGVQEFGLIVFAIS